MHKIKSKPITAQTAVEFAVVIAFVAAGLIAMQVYMSRGAMGYIRKAGNSICSTPFNPSAISSPRQYNKFDMQFQILSNTKTITKKSEQDPGKMETFTEEDGDSVTTEIMNYNVPIAEEEHEEINPDAPGFDGQHQD